MQTISVHLVLLYPQAPDHWSEHKTNVHQGLWSLWRSGSVCVPSIIIMQKGVNDGSTCMYAHVSANLHVVANSSVSGHPLMLQMSTWYLDVCPLIYSAPVVCEFPMQLDVARRLVFLSLLIQSVYRNEAVL